MLHAPSAIFSRKRAMMALPLGLHHSTAHLPLVSPELGVSKRKHAGHPGKKDPHRHGFCAARPPCPASLALDNSEFQDLRISEYPVFVPPGLENLSANSVLLQCKEDLERRRRGLFLCLPSLRGVSSLRTPPPLGGDREGVHSSAHRPHPATLALDNSELRDLGVSEIPVFVPPSFLKIKSIKNSNSTQPCIPYLTGRQWLLIAKLFFSAKTIPIFMRFLSSSFRIGR